MGDSADTATFAVEVIRRFGYEMGRPRFSRRQAIIT